MFSLQGNLGFLRRYVDGVPQADANGNFYYMWTAAGGGNWSDSANWLDGKVPNCQDAVVIVPDPTAENRTIVVDVPVTVGYLALFNNMYNRASSLQYTLYINGPSAITFSVSSGKALLVFSGDAQSGPFINTEINLQSDIIINTSAPGFARGFYVTRKWRNNGYKIYRHGRSQVTIDYDNSGLLVGGEIISSEGANNPLLLRYDGRAFGGQGGPKVVAYFDNNVGNNICLPFSLNNFELWRTGANTDIFNDIEFIRPSQAATGTRGARLAIPPSIGKATYKGAVSGELYPNTSAFTEARALYFQTDSDTNSYGTRYGIWLDGNHSGLIATKDTSRGVMYFSRSGGPIKIGSSWVAPASFCVKVGARNQADPDKTGDSGLLLDARRDFSPRFTDLDSWSVRTGQGSVAITAGSNVATASSGILWMYPGLAISGTGIPVGTTVASVGPDQFSFTMSQAATQSGSISLSWTATPRECAYPVIGTSHSSAETSSWSGQIRVNTYTNAGGSTTTATTSVAQGSAVILTKGSSVCEFKGGFIGTRADWTPLYKMGSGEAIISTNSSSIAYGRFLIQEGTLTVTSAFTAATNPTTFLVGQKRYKVEFNQAIYNGDVVQAIVNGRSMVPIAYLASASSSSGYNGQSTSGAAPFRVLNRQIAQHPDVGVYWADIDNNVSVIDERLYTTYMCYPRIQDGFTLSFNITSSNGTTATVTESVDVARLRGTSTIAGSVTLLNHANASIEPGSTASPYGTLTVGSLSAGANSILKFAVSGTSNAKIIVSGAYTAQGTFNITGNLQAGTYDLITCTGTLTAGTTSLNTSGATGFTSAVLSVNVASKKVQLIVT